MGKHQESKPGKPAGFGTDKGTKIGPKKASPLSKEAEVKKFSGDYTKFAGDEAGAVSRSRKLP